MYDLRTCGCDELVDEFCAAGSMVATFAGHSFCKCLSYVFVIHVNIYLRWARSDRVKLYWV